MRVLIYSGYLWLVLLALSGLSACARQPSPTPLPAAQALPTLSASLTATPSATFTARPSMTPPPAPTSTPTPSTLPSATASATASPSSTPTQTPTGTPPPTYTPASPVQNSRYQLAAWNDLQANLVIGRLLAYPETLEENERGYNDAGYLMAYRYAAFARQEALLRFPQSPFATGWQWELAYNQVQMGDEQAAGAYAAWIAEALNSREITLQELPEWFSHQESRLELAVHRLEALRQFESSHLVQITTGNSGLFLWLVRDLSGFHLYPLDYRNGFDLAYGVGLSFSLVDLTGDSIDELITLHSHQPGSGDAFRYTDINIYNLARTPPERIIIQPSPPSRLGPHPETAWSVLHTDDSSPILRLPSLPSDRCTAVKRVHDYLWNGETLQLAGSAFTLDSTDGDAIRFCLPFVFEAAEQGSLAALQYLADNLDAAPSPDTADEWRYRVAIYHALAGRTTQARAAFTDIISRPVASPSPWQRPAARFLESYQAANQLYRACAPADLCNERIALRQLAGAIPASAFAVVPDRLRQWGVSVQRAEFFDINDDEQAELWLLVNGSSGLEFWLLWRSPSGVVASFIDTVVGPSWQFSLERMTAGGDSPVIRLVGGREPLLFTWNETTLPGAPPTIVRLRNDAQNETGNYTPQLLADSQERLFRGEAPVAIRTLLADFQSSPAFNCTLGSLGSICPDYLYTLGLAHELAGEIEAATASYLQLWQRYPDSAYTIIARSRLALVPTPTPTSTQTTTPQSTTSFNQESVP